MESLFYLNSLQPQLQAYQHIVWIVADRNHWIQAEAYRSQGQVLFYLTSPSRLLPLIQVLRSALGVNGQHFALHCADQPPAPGMCGFQIVASLYGRLGVSMPPLSPSQERELHPSPYRPTLRTIWDTTNQNWAQTPVIPGLIQFAQTLRLLRLSRNQFPAQYAAAGMAQTSSRFTGCPTGTGRSNRPGLDQ